MGYIEYPNNIKDCYQKIDEIIQSIGNVVPNVNKSSKKTSLSSWNFSNKI